MTLRNFARLVTKYSGYRATNYRIISNPNSKISDFPKLEQEINKKLKHYDIFNSIIDNYEISSHYGKPIEVVSPLFNHTTIGSYYNLDPIYIKNSLKNHRIEKNKWNREPIDNKLEMFLELADSIENKYWNQMMATTIIGQGKSVYEAEIDCIGELVDFLRFNVQYAIQIFEKQPISTNESINISNYNPLQGFISSITPFNFTAIAGNLATAPLLFGNLVYWKPSEKSIMSNSLFHTLCLEVGIPSSVLNFIIADPIEFGNLITKHPDLGGVLFTGSNQVFNQINTNIVSNSKNRFQYPRIIGETGGKNFHFVEESADIDLVVQKTFEAAFNYSGQKCSACSRLYLPESMYSEFIQKIKPLIENIDKNMYGVIDKNQYFKTKKNIKRFKSNSNPNINLVLGGNTNSKTSYFIEPTIFLVEDSDNELFKTELFAPILGIRLYSLDELNDNSIINECINCTNYALTGAVFSSNMEWIQDVNCRFENSCGNFYINDKCTGAIVGQQPFGGMGLSGTNDKAGDINFLYRLFNQRNIKFNRNT